MQQRFSLGSNQYRSLRGWSAAPIFFAVRRPMPDELDVARANLREFATDCPAWWNRSIHGVDTDVLGIGLVDAEDRVSHCSPDVSRVTACAAPLPARNGLVSLTLKCRSTNATAPGFCSMDAPPEIQSQTIPSGYQGTLKTVEHIRDLIKQGAKDFHVRQTAIDILLQRAVKPKDYLGEIKALFEWVQQHVRYTKDTFRIEVLHSAKRMLKLRAGDCDDMAILLGAMLEAIGHPVRLVITGADPLRQDLFSHIYLEVFHKGRWIPLDATMPYPMGWAPRTLVKKIIAIERRPNMMSEDMELQGIGASEAGLAERTDPGGAQRGHTAQRRAGKVPVGPAAAAAIAAPKPMAQGGIAAYLDPWAVRSTSSAHGASDRTQACGVGDSCHRSQRARRLIA